MCGGMIAQRSNSASGLTLDSMLRAQVFLGKVLVEGVVKSPQETACGSWPHSHHAQHSSQHDPNTTLLDSTAVAFEPLPGLMMLFDSGRYTLLMFNGWVLLVTVILNLITLSASMLCLIWVKVLSLTQGMFQQKSGGHDYQLLLILRSLLIRDVAEPEEVSFWKPDKILPHSVLLTCKQVQLIECTLPSLWCS